MGATATNGLFKTAVARTKEGRKEDGITIQAFLGNKKKKEKGREAASDFRGAPEISALVYRQFPDN